MNDRLLSLEWLELFLQNPDSRHNEVQILIATQLADTMRELSVKSEHLAHNERLCLDLQRQNERLREILEFYAERKNYEAIGGTIPDVLPAICKDHGKKAYKALSNKESE